MTENQPNICNICGTAITNIERGISFTTTDHDGKPKTPYALYQGWCPSCEISLNGFFKGKKFSGWSAYQVDSKNIGSSVSEEEFEEMENKIASLKEIINDMVKEDWLKFKKIKKNGDSLFNHINDEGEKDGFIIRRGDLFVGVFIPFFFEEDFEEDE